MINPEKLFAGEGGYVFVSHSHLDIASVRRIRNALEEYGLEPILFYLRSMDDGNPSRAELLKKLICDEIDAREFFLYVSSKNAERSQWVQDELTHVRQNAPQKITVLDLERDGDRINEWMEQFVCRLRVFISYARQDAMLAARLQNALLARDFRVYDMEKSIGAGDVWSECVRHTISDVSEAGHVLVLVTENSLRSSAVRQELETALNQQKPITSILVGDVKLPIEWTLQIAASHCIRLSPNPTEDELNRLIDWI